jgi:hypothetical protein
VKRIVSGFVVILTVAVHAADQTPKARFDAALIEAKANLETPAGKAYDVAISKHFEDNFGPVLNQCFKTTPKPDASAFEMVVELSGEGKPREILMWPETNIAKCFKTQLSTASLPMPPKDGYRAYMEMRFSR